ncbi:MAG: hypothetical protein R2722_09500 [Tessaracoccus sp.]
MAARVPLASSVVNSLIVTVIGATIKVFLAITTAYALVFIKIRGAGIVFMAILVALMVPTEAAMLPNTSRSPPWVAAILCGASSCRRWAPPSAPSCCASIS